MILHTDLKLLSKDDRLLLYKTKKVKGIFYKPKLQEDKHEIIHLVVRTQSTNRGVKSIAVSQVRSKGSRQITYKLDQSGCAYSTKLKRKKNNKEK